MDFKWRINKLSIAQSIGGSKWGARDARPLSVQFLLFSNIRFLPQTQGLPPTPHPPVWEILDPPLLSAISLLLNIVFILFLHLSVALSDILDAFDLPENERRIEEARDSAGNDMLKMMQIVFPITTQIQMSVIGKYGFPEDGDGNHALT